ncbi:neugrin [Echeneis naucrates]|uniref:Neugrin n=1 Tax=Echeneis naucrates TaxID=173247 RepID=A0A665UW18_ECHNA|nr:neugrin [Echeneis naucrates]XP_029362443.1 neugrin [Echeneis naucrates]
MARPLQVLRLLPRLRALSGTTTGCCGFTSGGTRGPWTGQGHVGRDRAPRHGDHEEDVEDVEDKLQALVDEGRKRKRTVKYHMLRRQMTPPGAPHRKLTWDAIEQIRCLKQENPEEWTVERLAQGFSVAPDVILRILRSKFVPTPERKAKQDTKVMAVLGRNVLPSGTGAGRDRLKLLMKYAPATLSSGSREGALISPANHTLLIKEQGSRSLAETPAPVSMVPTQFIAGASQAGTVTRSSEDSPTNTSPLDEDTEDEEHWDGLVLTEEELEELIKIQKAAPPVAQVGKDFFDADGNFLYRI